MERVSYIFMMNGAFIFYSVPGHQKIRADPILSSVISIDIQRNAPLSGLADARSIYFDPFDSSAHGVATAVPPAPGVCLDPQSPPNFPNFPSHRNIKYSK